MPARTLNDFFAGFFYGQSKEDLEVKMEVAGQNDWRKSDKRQSHRRKGNIGIMKIGEEGDRGQEITVRYKTVPRRKDESTFSWFEEFTIEWSETFICEK
jgi:hypothetical protein